MAKLFNQYGNFLFHNRNVLFPVLIILLFALWPPVPMSSIPGIYFTYLGIVFILLGQSLRILTIGLSYIVRGGKNRRIYAEKLVTDGMFAHSRNPLYLGNLMIVIGFVLIAGNITGIILGSLVFTIIYSLIVHSEETFLRATFDGAYDAYCADTPRWLPRFNRLRETISQYDFDWPAVAVKEYGTIMTSLMIPLTLTAYKLQIDNKLYQYQGLLLGLALIVMATYGIVRYLKKTERLRSMR